MSSKHPQFIGMIIIILFIPGFSHSDDSQCIGCHERVTPNIVEDFLSGAMGKSGIDCSECHGSAHKTSADAVIVQFPTVNTCRKCHALKVEQYLSGKHSLGWTAIDSMPDTGFQPHPYIKGINGCGGCHKVGIRDEGRKVNSKNEFACGSCHTPHKFSMEEARKPEACRSCHKGFDHPQWEMWSLSKHGENFMAGADANSATTCQTCHMVEGDHRVMTSWGAFALRFPEADEEWLGYRTIILKALQMLDMEGKPTPFFNVVKEGKIARLTEEEWQAERDRKLDVCMNCHGKSYARKNLKSSDALIKEADKLMAEAIEVVAELYKKGVLKPKRSKPGFPHLLTDFSAMSPIEQKLNVMFSEHRMRVFKGAFHMNPTYLTQYGLSEMKLDLMEIQTEARRLINEAERKLQEGEKSKQSEGILDWRPSDLLFK